MGSSSPVLDPDLDDLVSTLSEKLGLKSKVLVAETDEVDVPTVAGWLRPQLLLPSERPVGRAELGAVLIHELAHVVRRDPIVQAAARTTQALWWWHPLAWVAARQVAASGEEACDDWVVGLTADRRGYANVVTRWAEAAGSPGTVACASRGNTLVRRVRRILDRAPLPALRLSRRWRWALAVSFVAIVLVAGLARFRAAPAEKPGSGERGGTADSHGAAAEPGAPLTVEERVRRFFEGFDRLQNPPGSDTVIWSLSCGLSNMGPEAVPALSEAVGRGAGTGGTVRWRQAVAAPALGRIGTGEAIEALLHSTAYRDDLAQAIALAGEEAVEPLIAALDDPSDDVRLLAIEAMGRLRDGACVPALVERVEGGDAGLRAKAAWALGEIGDPRAVEALIKLAGADTYAAIQAIEALGKIGHPDALDTLVQALDAKPTRVAEAAAAALPDLGDPRAVDPLIRAVGRDDPRAIVAACHALAAFGDPKAIPALADLLDKRDDSQVAYAAGLALANTGDVRAVEPLVRRLERGVDEMDDSMMLGGYLADLGAAATPTLTRLVSAEDTDIRTAAACGLCLQGDVRGLVPLVDAPTDGAASEGKRDALQDLLETAPAEVAAMLSPGEAKAETRRKVVEACQRALSELAEESPPREVLVALKRAACTDPDPAVREAALDVLQRWERPPWL